jgi:hypothetical protein
VFRPVIASLLVTAVLGSVILDAAAETLDPSGSPAAAATASSKNPAPLEPRGAAGIRLAQGSSDRGILIASGAILVAIVAALLLIEDDDDDTTANTGTN